VARAFATCGLMLGVCLLLAASAFAARVCPSCGATMPDDYNFCEDCGSALAPMATCPECGAKYPEGTVSCTCGYVFLKPKTVTVTVAPAKAAVYVNGLKKGTGKAVVTLAPGETALVEGRLKGYVTNSELIKYENLAEGEVTLTLEKEIPTYELKAGVKNDGGVESKGLLTGISVGFYGGVAIPFGEMGSKDQADFEWYIIEEEIPYAELEDIYLTGSGLGLGSIAGGKIVIGMTPYLDVVVAGTHHISHTYKPDRPLPSGTNISSFTGGLNYTVPFLKGRIYFGPGAGYYIAKIYFFSEDEIIVGSGEWQWYEYARVDEVVDLSSWGYYAGAGLTIPWFGKIAFDINSQVHFIMDYGDFTLDSLDLGGYFPPEYRAKKRYYDTYVDFNIGVLYELW
jgi:ribosomal protein L40E